METPNIIYISLDMEADGPVPGRNSMLSLGAVAYDADGTEIGWYGQNLSPLPGAEQNPATMLWWANYPQAWATITANPQEAGKVMQNFAFWLDALCRTHKAEAVMVAYPASYDYDFVLYYARRFLGSDPFGGRVVDMRSMAMGLLGGDYRTAAKARMPDAWFAGNTPHTHVSWEDARAQGELFVAMLKAARAKGAA
jgi:DNA polymerase III alpha subunit (gram-positive type)